MIRPIIIIIAAASLGLFFLHLKPSYAEILDIREEKQKVDETLEQFEEAARLLERLSSSYRNIHPEDIEKLDAFLPRGVDNVELVLSIHQIASNYGLIITGLAVESGDESKGAARETSAPYNTAAISFSVETNYEVFLAFLSDLERSIRPFDIVKIVFGAGDENRYTFNLTAHTYWIE